jgi:alcohol dehydrogenase class IV
MNGTNGRVPSFVIESHGPTTFAAGGVQRLPELVHALRGRSVFIVTDQGVIGAGVCAVVEGQLRHAGFEVATFGNIRPNPDTEQLDAGARVIRDFTSGGSIPGGSPVVVAVGGGAVLDVAKGLALMAVNPGTARDFEYLRQPERGGLPVIALPTTAGTGSETNPWGVIDDPAVGRKFYIGHASVQPRFVILDPELTLSLPPRATAAAGMDALAHALESLSSIRRNPYADALNREVVRMVARSLPATLADGGNVIARGDMLIAAHLAGLAFATTGLGVAHALAHSLSARIGAAHGVALSVLLPHVLAFNLPVRREVYADLAGLLEANSGAWSEAVRAGATIEAVRQLGVSSGLPQHLRELGVTEMHIPQIVEDALIDSVITNTPREPVAPELAELLEAAL